MGAAFLATFVRAGFRVDFLEAAVLAATFLRAGCFAGFFFSAGFFWIGFFRAGFFPTADGARRRFIGGAPR
ncbi:MAG: hypothetical protein ACERNK_10570 [Deltaproteobacteria bacterium]